MIRIRLNPDSEDARRMRKVARIVAEIDARIGTQYGEGAEIVLVWVEALDDDGWSDLGAAAGYPSGASTTTRAMIAEFFRGRARKVAS